MTQVDSNSIVQVTERVIEEIKDVLDDISEEDAQALIKNMLNAKRVFVFGGGRSGLVSEAFAMRSVQLGLEGYMIGESTTPKISKGDFLIVISGSGKTRVSKEVMKIGKDAGAKTCLITSNLDTKIAKESDLVIQIKAKTKIGERESIEPLGSLFEKAAMVYLDSIVVILMEKLDVNENFMRERHSNIYLG